MYRQAHAHLLARRIAMEVEARDGASRLGIFREPGHSIFSYCFLALDFDAGQGLRMESDRIRMESDSDSTFYHILTRIRIQIRMLSDTMQNGCLEFEYGFGYLLDLEHSFIHLFYSL